jgi:phosphatidate cytidylyltransferase
MLLRLISIAVLAPPFLAAVWFGSPYFEIVLIVGSLIAMYEWWGVASAGETRSWPWCGFGLIYIIIACVSLAALRALPEIGRDLILWLFLVVWAADIGGYVFGRLIGGPKLAPNISPGKTWAGTMGGFLAATAISGLFSKTLGGNHGMLFLAVAGLAIGFVAQIGDLFESYFKRKFDVKDSGAIIPGHGGILDRIDSILLVAPCVWAGTALFHGSALPWK